MSTGQMAVATTTTGSALIPSQLTISSPALFSGGPAAIHAVNIVDLFTAYLRPGDPASQEILPKRPSCQWVTGPLSPFLRKDAIVMGNLRTRKILKRDFEEAWARYVPLEPIPKGAGKVMAACSTIAWGGLAALGLGALGAVDLTYPQMIASKITYLIGLGGMTLDLLIPLSAFTFLRNRIWAEFIGNTHELEATQAKKNPDPDPSMLTVKEALAMAIAEGFPDLNLPDYVARRFDQQTLLQLKNLARGYMALAITPTLMSHPYESLGGTARANAFLREQEREIKDAGIEGGAILANIEGAIRAIGHEPLMFELEEVSRMDRIHRQIAEIGRAASDLRMPNTRANLKILYDHWELLSEIRSYPLLPSGIIKEKLDHLANKLERRIINLEWQIGVRIKAFDKVEYVFDLAAEGNEDFDSPVPYAAKLGSGGMSVVYRAHRAEGLKSVGDTVAIRILRFDKLLADGTLNMEVLTRKILEQFAMQRDRSHPGVMRVLNYGALPNDGPYYLITEYLDGITLEHTLLRMRSERQMTTPRKVLKIIREILAALEETQLIHRDLKPDNIFVVPTKGAPARHVISDLDLATRGDLQAGIALPDLVGADGQPLMGGTYPFLCPRAKNTAQDRSGGSQMSGVMQSEEKADVYAIGVMAYQMLTGRKPFPIYDLTSYNRYVMNGPKAFGGLKGIEGIPNAYLGIVKRALAFRRRDRPTRAEMIETIDLYLTGWSMRGEPDRPLPLPPLSPAERRILERLDSKTTRLHFEKAFTGRATTEITVIKPLDQVAPDGQLP